MSKGVAKVQREIIVKCVDGALQRNATRAKAGKAPMTYDEVVEEFKRVLNVVMQIHVDKDLYTGDGYGPGCKGNCGKEAVETSTSADGKGGEKKKAEKKPSEYRKTADEQFRKKERLTCKVRARSVKHCICFLKLNVSLQDWNLGECRYGAGCKYKHKCSKRIAPAKICWKEHKKTECTENTFGLGR